MGNGVNWDAVQGIFCVVNFIFLVGVTIWTRQLAVRQLTDDKLTAATDALEKLLADHAQRITRLEAGPTHDDMAQIHEKLNAMNANLRDMAGEFRGTKDLLATLHQHLLDQH